jgi:hypothetical protein
MGFQNIIVYMFYLFRSYFSYKNSPPTTVKNAHSQTPFPSSQTERKKATSWTIYLLAQDLSFPSLSEWCNSKMPACISVAWNNFITFHLDKATTWFVLLPWGVTDMCNFLVLIDRKWFSLSVGKLNNLVCVVTASIQLAHFHGHCACFSS